MALTTPKRDESALRQVLEATATGALFGSMVGSIQSYMKSPVIIGYNRAPVWRDVSQNLYRATGLWTGVFFTYVFTKHLSTQFTGNQVPDATNAAIAGAATGAFYSGVTRGTNLKMMSGAAIACGLTAYIFAGPWAYLGTLNRRERIMKSNDEEMALRYKKKVAEDRKSMEAELIEVERKALAHVQ